MRNHVRTLVVVILSFGLLALFFRGAHLNEVWAEIKEANLWLLTVAAATTVVNMVTSSSPP